MDIQNDYVNIILNILMKFLKKEKIDEIMVFLDDMNITNDMLKEHVMSLSMDKQLIEAFDKLPTQTKSAFTRAYNKTHCDPTKKTVKKGGKKSAAVTKTEEDDEEEEEEDAGGELLDEDEIIERKKGK